MLYHSRNTYVMKSDWLLSSVCSKCELSVLFWCTRVTRSSSAVNGRCDLALETVYRLSHLVTVTFRADSERVYQYLFYLLTYCSPLAISYQVWRKFIRLYIIFLVLAIYCFMTLNFDPFSSYALDCVSESSARAVLVDASEFWTGQLHRGR